MSFINTYEIEEIKKFIKEKGLKNFKIKSDKHFITAFSILKNGKIFMKVFDPLDDRSRCVDLKTNRTTKEPWYDPWDRYNFSSVNSTLDFIKKRLKKGE